MSWQEQSPLNVLLGTVIGGLAANRKNEDALLDKEYARGQAMNKADLDKRKVDAQVSRDTATGAYYQGKLSVAQSAEKREQRKSGLTPDGAPTYQVAPLPVGDGKHPATPQALIASLRTTANNAAAAGAYDAADAYGKRADSVLRQYVAETAAAERAIQDRAQRENWSAERLNQALAISATTINARIHAAASVQSSSNIAGGMIGSANVRAATQKSEGALNRDATAERQNVRAAQQFDLSKYNQQGVSKRFNAGQQNDAMRTVTNAKSRGVDVPLYEPVTVPVDPDAAAVPAPSDEESNDFLTGLRGY